MVILLTLLIILYNKLADILDVTREKIVMVQLLLGIQAVEAMSF